MGNLFFANMLIIIIHQCACAAVQSEAGGAFCPPTQRGIVLHTEITLWSMC